MQQQGTIDTRLDIDAGRQRKNLIKKSTSEKNKYELKKSLIN